VVIIGTSASQQLNPKGPVQVIGLFLFRSSATMIDIETKDDVSAIRTLNDALRRTGAGGKTMLSRGIAGLPTDALAKALRAVAAFDAFMPDNDPYGEHDCASLEVEGHSIIWKIDYFDPTLSHHSDDATDPALTRRVLTIMLAEEY
jgi:hypothetical protein